ncbi:MAG: ATP-binding cassette domain-containing protein [Candidatus Cloacimonetes bacterium]|nr:ATP-binding cassette domain-containing protein [Candidatus Cloacimonadota bacterium]
MIKVSLTEVCAGNGLNCFSGDIMVDGCTVLYDPSEQISTAILSALIGLDGIDSGIVQIDGMPYDEYFQNHELISTFALVFAEGIMLSNLTIRENLSLPWKLRFPSEKEDKFNAELQSLMQTLELDCDVNQRPAFISPACRKLFGFIRGVMLKPRLLLIDDPFYLFNKLERGSIFRFLNSLKPEQDMLIASADDEFLGDFATHIINLSIA